MEGAVPTNNRGSQMQVAQVTLNGNTIDFDAAVSLMDDEIREELNAKIGGCSEQEFLDAYVQEHAKKFGGEEFQVA